MKKKFLEYRTRTVNPKPGPQWRMEGSGGRIGLIQESRFLIGRERRLGFLNEDGVLIDAESGTPLGAEEVSAIYIRPEEGLEEMIQVCASEGYQIGLDVSIQELNVALMLLDSSEVLQLSGMMMSNFIADPGRDYWDTVRLSLFQVLSYRWVDNAQLKSEA